ncbi:MAG: proteasome ATPase [Corynebacterium sp.]|nr:proteasome ATPase [Corynebacterium sp.]
MPTSSSQSFTEQQAGELAQLRRHVRELGARNQKLVELLTQTRNKLEDLNAKVKELNQPPSTYGVFISFSPQTQATAEVFTSQRMMRLTIAPHIVATDLKPGCLVRIGEASQIVEVCDYATTGALVVVDELLDQNRVLVSTHSGEQRVMSLAQPLIELRPKAGDTVLADTKAGFVLEVISASGLTGLGLEEIPDVKYEDIGGLSEQIEAIHDAVELPFTHPDLYKTYNLHAPKGVLLYGPPGCGKTLIAKAVANSLSARTGKTSHFINVKGPELLNKYVGETERHIRHIFERARELGSAGQPVVVFFDEMESIFRTRGTGRSSDMETTVVPQLLAELDGVESLSNVIIIGATNREELIDPAILRPGRLDVKIRISRPDQKAAAEIFSRYINTDIPLASPPALLIDAAVQAVFADHPTVELELENGASQVLHFRDFISGAMIANIVARAKKSAIKECLIGGGTCGITTDHLLDAIAAERDENEDLPNTAKPDEWARVSGLSLGHRVLKARILN